MVKGRVTAASTAAERKKVRASIGSLKDLRVGVGVQKRYRSAVSFFLWWVMAFFGRLAEDFEELDRHAVAFIHAAWDEGEARSIVADILSGLLHLLDRKKILPSSWSWLTTWEQHEMPVRAHPAWTQLILAIAGVCWHHGHLEVCCIVPVAFCCMLRTADFLDLRRSHVAFS